MEGGSQVPEIHNLYNAGDSNERAGGPHYGFALGLMLSLQNSADANQLLGEEQQKSSGSIRDFGLWFGGHAMNHCSLGGAQTSRQ